MEIELKNGEKLNLEVTPLLLEYIEEYDGGIEGIQKDIATDNKQILAINHVLYSVICSNYDEPLTYRQAIRLIKIDDMEKIAKFLLENVDQLKLTQKNTKSNKKQNQHKM